MEYNVANDRNDFEKLGIITVNNINDVEPTTNHVIVEFYQHTNQTVGGILIGDGVKQFNFGNYTERNGVVVKVCKDLLCTKHNEESMMWECDIDVERGDEIFTDPGESLHSQKIYCKKTDKIYSLIFYGAIVLTKRGSNIIMCNGYVLLEMIEKEHPETNLAIYDKDKYIFNEGIVRYCGKPNKRYRTKNKGSKTFRTDDGCDIKPGDHVWLDMPQFTWFLEDWCFAIFDNRKLYKVAKRYMIAANYGT